ncbi:MAG: hypothetical protein ABIV94_01390 [Acidimicrobiales bacterium]
MSRRERVGCYPGSFNPPTVAHLAVAAAARSSCRLDRIDLVVSRVALAKESVAVPSLEDRLAVLRSVVSAPTRSSWLGLVLTDAQLLVDVAEGYDVLVLGADKWTQVLDPSFYRGSASARDAAVAALPALAVAPRDDGNGSLSLPLPVGTIVLAVPDSMAGVSSTAVRVHGRSEWMVEEAAAFDRETGAWTDPSRYAAWSARRA